MIVLACVALAALIVVLLLALPLSIRVSFQRRGKDDSGEVDVRYLFGLVHVRHRLVSVDAQVDAKEPKLHLRHQPAGNGPSAAKGAERQRSIGPDDVKRFVKQLPEWRRLLIRVRPTMEKLLLRVHIQRFSWHMVLGTGDVVTCGVSCGAAWSLLSVAGGWLSQACKLEEVPDLRVQPDFDRARFETTIECIARVRAGYAISAGVRLIRAWRRRRTRGASDSGIDAHGDDKHP